MRTRVKLAVGASVIAVALGYVIYAGARNAAVYYLTPAEFVTREERANSRFVRIAGRVDEQSIRRDVATQTWEFTIYDGTARVPVRYQGVPPDLFTVTREVIAEGRQGADGVFVVERLLATHPTGYQERK